MLYREFAPPALLAPSIRCFWTLRGRPVPLSPGSVERLIPDGSPELVLHLADPFVQVIAGMDAGSSRGRIAQPAALIAGQLRGPLLLAPTGEIDLIAVRFRPAGLRAILGGRDAADLTDRRIAVSEIDPALDLALDRVRAAAGERARVAALAEVLAKRFADSLPARRGPIAAAAEIIERTGGQSALDELSRAVGLSERSLQRGFRREVGLSPKRLARIFRFQRFFRALEGAPPGGIAGLALDCGYYDQPHLLHDARELAGGATGILAEGTALARLFSRGAGERDGVSGSSKPAGGSARENGWDGRTPSHP